MVRDELQAQIAELTEKILKLERTLMIVFLAGSRATQVAMNAGLDPKIPEDELASLMAMIERGELKINIPKETA
jgi:hypothetical protein